VIRHALAVRARLTALLATVLLLVACAGDGTHRVAGEVMGTTWSATVVRPPAGVDAAELRRELQARLDRVNALMSTWLDDSELSRVNAAPAGEWLPLSRETLEVLDLSREAWRLTAGAFDVTVGPLVDLWGFGPVETGDAEPDAAALEAARAGVGFDAIELRSEPPGLRKAWPRRIDLSAVAKGYAVDLAAAYLEQLGVAGYLLEVGGELRSAGRKADGSRWVIGIEAPELSGGAPVEAIRAGDAAVATSGDYRNFRVVDGRRLSHTIDPRTGRPVTHSLASVTVVADTAAWADALATGLTVLGGDAALSLAEREGLAVYLIERSPGGGHRARYSAAFEQYLQ
jgi:thiamine biosynthesis lipoprotein